MADSKDNDKDPQSDDLADDLDAMLNEVDLSDEEQDELINDEDAIDRLLIDDAFDIPEEPSTTDKVQPEQIEQVGNQAKKEAEDLDEFTDNEHSDTNSQTSTNKADDTEDELEVDELIDSVVSDSSAIEDEFVEIADLQADNNSLNAEIKDQTDSGENNDEFSEDNIEPEAIPKTTSDDDFLMADFDISVDDELEDELVDDIVDASAEESPVVEVEKSSEDITPSEDHLLNQSAIAEITDQIELLITENETLKQQIIELTASVQDTSTATEIEELQKEQRKLRKSVKENEAKVPVIVYVAIGIAVFSLLVAAGLGAIGYGAKSDVTELSELVITLEEEIEIITTQNSSKEINKINDKINLLIAKDEDANKQLAEVNEAIQSNSLKPTVDDLVIQNDHAQQAIEQLLAKVDTLEKHKTIIPRKKVKKPVIKATWVVNLVSFKQEWYAKRKAAEFEKKAVPAEVIKVKVKGENWYRLTVKGFKSKYEAAAYAVKVKKSLNLSSVWVTKG